MQKPNKSELIRFIFLVLGGILFLTDKSLKVEFLNPIMDFREIILYSGLAIWALGLVPKENLKRKKQLEKRMNKAKYFQGIQRFLSDFKMIQNNSRKWIQYIIIIIFTLTGCKTQSVSTIVGGDYDKNKDRTAYFVLPFGSTFIPGKWTKTSYNEVSKQQFFRNEENVSIAIAFVPANGYEFNTGGSKKGFEFTKAFYEWDADYFVKTLRLNQEKIESDENKNYIIWRAFGEQNGTNFDTYFLFGEKNGCANNFSITITDKWTKEEKIKFLKEMYLQK